MSLARRRTLVVLLLTVPVGLALKYWAGPGRWWLNNWGASVAYEVFFVSLVFLVVGSRARLGAIAIGVCAGTVALEFLQLWQPSWLMAVRSTFPGQAVLGNAFSWRDLPAYPLGCWVAWWLLGRLAGRDSSE